MKAFVGVTDREWFELLSKLKNIDEVNFWQPSARTRFSALAPGELFLFKLHSPTNYIVGGGFFAHYSRLPVSLAWQAFGEKNGALTLEQMRARIGKYRRITPKPNEDYQIGCILLEQPFFFPEYDWIPVPTDWKPNIVRGKGYDLTVEPGLSLYQAVRDRLQAQPQENFLDQPEEYEKLTGKPTLVLPRLGQGSFRVLVTDAYRRRCAVTRERTLPVLEAAHIKPWSLGGPHEVDNGILLRSDVHILFDRGYVTITPDYHLEVSKKIKEEYENGRDYYALHGSELSIPEQPEQMPNEQLLEWHNENVYLG